MNKAELTLGSLFDGSGGFPLAGILCGIRPVWASEIEPFPIRVTTKRLSFVKHYGDVTKINGGEIEPVDVITFGSPCTDMSTAGKRAGLDGTQSVLFYQAIRIIKEMRDATDEKYPEFIVWENVPGAFSSNKGADFKSVLDAIVGIVEAGVEVPAPEKGRWARADCFVGDGWSVAYRTLDAQYFGVPQRRRRIYLVADFAGERAPEILFEPKGVRRNFAPRFGKREGIAGVAEVGSGAAGTICLNDQGGAILSVSESVSGTLRAQEHGHQPCVVESAGFCTEHSSKSRGVGYQDERSPTLRAGVVPSVAIDKFPVLPGQHAATFALTTGSFTQVAEECSPTLLSRDYKDPPAVSQPGSGYVVRRLTPAECAGLQGFPDGWCAGLETESPTEADILFWRNIWETHRKIAGTSSKPKTRNQIVKWLRNPHSDSAEYRMWGNGIALPCARFVLEGIVSCI